MESNSSNNQDYLIAEESEDDSEFSFVTTRGIKYLVYFKEADGYVPFASFAQDIKMFGFGPTKETRSEGKLPRDGQIGIAIFEILYYYISKYPHRILLFVCSNESIWYPGIENKHPRYAKWRSNKFSEWFYDWQRTGIMPAEK